MQLNSLQKLFLILLSVTFLASCGQKKADQKQAGGFPPAEVGVVTISSEEITVTNELPGRLEAIRVADVRARTTGILLKQLFREGADVNADDVLFEIDLAPLQASLNNAQANLDKAQATLTQMQSRANRYKSLTVVNAISKQEYDDAVSAELQAQAGIQSAKAAKEMAELNLGYATVKAPISGRIGSAKVTEGTLVSQLEATHMATIQQLDPIYFDFTQSSTDVLKLRRSLEQGLLESVAPGQAKVTLLLEDGTTYPLPGKLLFSDITVNRSTGMITVRAEFDNPDYILLPGMFARVRLEQAINNEAITVLQRGVILGPNGTATVMVIGAEDKVEERTIKLSNAIGDKWIVSSGLRVGDRVIVEGLQKVMPGAVVKPVSFNTMASETTKTMSQNK